MPRHVDCKCGHDWKTHLEDASAPQCIAPRCTCLRYIPVTAPPRFRPKPTAPELVRDPKMSDSAEAVNDVPEPAPRVTPLREPLSRPPLAAAPPVPEPEISARATQGPTADELPKAGMRSQIPRTVKLAEKIALMVHDLRGRVADERRAAEKHRKAEEEKAQARADVERLTREPAAAKARLQGKTSGAPAAAAPNEGLDRRGRHINRTPANCPDCGKRSGTSASAISSLTSWASRTGPRDGPTSGGSYAGRPCPTVTLHAARHSSVTAMRDAGVPDHDVAAWHGHDEVVMRRTYSHAGQDGLAAAGQTLADVLGGTAAPMA